jgi:hypothetical protein
MAELYMAVVRCLAGVTALTFLSATSTRISLAAPEPTEPAAVLSGGMSSSPTLYNFINNRIELNTTQQEDLRRVIDRTLISALGVAGSTVGSIFGPIGATVGGAIGATAGLIAWLWSRPSVAVAGGLGQTEGVPETSR